MPALRVLLGWLLVVAGVACGTSDEIAPERRAAARDWLFMWCDDGQRTAHRFLEIDGNGALRLPDGEGPVVLDYTAAEIRNGWLPLLCAEGEVNRTALLFRAGDSQAALASRYPVIDREQDRKLAEIPEKLRRMLYFRSIFKRGPDGELLDESGERIRAQ